MGAKAERKCVDEIDPPGVAGCYITDSRTKTMLLITNTWNYRVIFYLHMKSFGEKLGFKL